MSPDPSGIRRGFIVEAGGTVNGIIAIPATVSTVGRDPGADLCLPYDGVSRQHLRLDATGPVVFVTDAHSTNGTWINDRREAERTPLRDGDRVKLGSVRLRYFDAASAGPSGMPPTDMYQVTQPQPGAAGDGSDRHGLTQDRNKVGRDQHNIAGDQLNVGRDQYNSAGNQTWKQKVKISANYEPTDELFLGEGPGRVIAIIGLIVTIGGFAWFASHIFGFIGSVSSIGAGGAAPVGFPPTIGYAFATFGLGALLLMIGTGMSKARRKRNRK